MRPPLRFAAAVIAVLSCAVPGAAGERDREPVAATAASDPAQAKPPASGRKFSKPPGDALALSVLEARIRVRRRAPSDSAEILPAGVSFGLAGGVVREMPFGIVGYCQKPGKVGPKQSQRWMFASFRDLAWETKDEAESFCLGWNRLVYAYLTGEGMNQGLIPPESALRLTPGMARAAIRELIPKRHLVSFEIGEWTLNVKLSDLNPEKTTRLLDGTVERIGEFGFYFRHKEETLVKKEGELIPQQTEEHDVILFEHDYGDASLSSDGSFWQCGGLLFAWKQQQDAQRFCDARNRLAYAAAIGEADDALPGFEDSVRAFRAGTAPAPPEELERHRVLAENAFQEKDYFGALEHYEAGLRVYQPWPEGWFNAALLYEAIGEWHSAISRMNRYLALVPDAEDAKAAKEKLIIWTEKAKR